MKRTVKAFIAVMIGICMMLSVVGLVACDFLVDEAPKANIDPEIYAIYLAYAEEAGDSAMTYEEWYADLLAHAKGEKGDKGDDGEKGDKGDPGEKGDKGDDGANGTNGKDGNMWIVGTADPSDGDGNDGDLYLDYTTWNVWHKEEGKWVLLGNIKGADGGSGDSGEVDEPVADYTGSGTAEDPYIVNTADGMVTFASNVNSGAWTNVYVELGRDIDLAGKEWTPIGNATNKFTGSFDGKYHTISNITITESADYIGLFGTTGDNSQISNVKIVGANIDVDVAPAAGAATSYKGAGVLVGATGSAKGNPTIITNIIVDSSSVLDITKTNTNGYYAVGGIVGATINAKVMLVQYSGTINVNSNASSNFKIGGITGFVQGSKAIGATDGAVLAAIFNGTLSVTTTAGTTQDIGGIAGYAGSSSYSYVDNCIFSGSINVESASKLYVGGIVGKANSDGANASYNIAAGSINAPACTVSNFVAYTDDDDADAKGNSYATDTTTVGKTVDNSNGSGTTTHESSWFYVKENVHSVFSAVSLSAHISGNIVDYLDFSGSALPTLAWLAD